jgi:hypothetical protein
MDMNPNIVPYCAMFRKLCERILDVYDTLNWLIKQDIFCDAMGHSTWVAFNFIHTIPSIYSSIVKPFTVPLDQEITRMIVVLKLKVPVRTTSDIEKLFKDSDFELSEKEIIDRKLFDRLVCGGNEDDDGNSELVHKNRVRALEEILLNMFNVLSKMTELYNKLPYPNDELKKIWQDNVKIRLDEFMQSIQPTWDKIRRLPVDKLEDIHDKMKFENRMNDRSSYEDIKKFVEEASK